MDGGFDQKPQGGTGGKPNGKSSGLDNAGTAYRAAKAQLLSFVERVERVEEEEKELRGQKKMIYAEASGAGYDAPAIRRIVKKRKKTLDQRREEQAIDELYEATLGMLDGTPLGSWAIKKLEEAEEEEKAKKSGKPAKPKAPDKKPPGGSGAPDIFEEMLPAAADPEPEEDTEAARRAGAAAHLEGLSITKNPFPPFSKSRAAWEEGWMSEAGSSDGMDAPMALRRKDDKGRADRDKDKGMPDAGAEDTARPSDAAPAAADKKSDADNEADAGDAADEESGEEHP